MWVGVDAGGWQVPLDVKGALDWVRLDTPTATRTAAYVNAGVNVLDDIAGPYNSNGVSGLNPDTWAANAVATYRASPSIKVIEILNEPGGSWFWGSNALSQTNANAYAVLLQKVRLAFDAEPSRPLLIASYDGGLSTGPNTWGQEVFANTVGVNVAQYIDGITIHPYGGTADRTASALGNRANVAAAHTEQPGLPIYITEVGWPTAYGQPNTGDSFQFTEAEQAANIWNFVDWARGTGYIAAVSNFNLVDYGSNTWYGIEHSDQTHKPSYEAIRRAALGLPWP